MVMIYLAHIGRTRDNIAEILDNIARMRESGKMNSMFAARRSHQKTRVGRFWLLLVGLIAVLLGMQSTYALEPGDIAIVGVRADDIDNTLGNGNDDAFAWVPLVDLTAGAQIFFTDAGWTSAGAFRPQEGAISYIAPAGGISAGTVMLLEFTPPTLGGGSYVFTSTNGGTYASAEDAQVGTVGFLPATPGDNIFVFEGTSTTPVFLWGWKNEGAYDTDSTSNDSTALPPGLTVGTTALFNSGNSADNNRYTGRISGTRAELLAAIADPTNWEALEEFPFSGGGNDITNGATGFVLNPQDISVDRTTADFGQVALDVAPLPSIIVVVSNDGGLPLTIGGATVTGTHSTSFSVASTCTATLAPAASCNYTITFNPLSDNAAGSKTATLTIDSDDPDEAQLPITLSAENIVGDLTVTPLTLDLGAVRIGESNGNQITLSTAGVININSIVLTGNNIDEFSFATGCPANGLFGNNSTTCTITANLLPNSIGQKSAVITVNSNDQNEPAIQVALSGEGLAALSPGSIVVPTRLNFGNVAVGNSPTADLQISNSGQSNLTLGNIAAIDALATPFSVVTDGCSAQILASQQSCTITLMASPNAVGQAADSFDIPSDDPTNASSAVIVEVNGTASPTPDITVNPAGLDFAQVMVGLSSGLDVSVSNSGDATLTINSVTGNNAAFAVTNGCASLAPNASCTVNVVFSPTAEGAFDSNLTIVSDDPDEGTLVLGMMGSGFVTAVPIISLDTQQLVFPLTGIGGIGSVRNIIVTNSGASTSNLTISSISAAGTNAAVFPFSHNCAVLAASESCAIAVRFTPTVLGAHTANLIVNSDDPNNAQIVVSLSGTASSDDDGIDDTVEGGAPNNGDGNNDGTPDISQSNVASLPDLLGAYITLVSPTGTTLSDVSIIANPDPGSTPPGFNLRAGGFIKFTINNLAVGSSATVSIILPAAETATSYLLYGPEASNNIDHFYEFADNGTTGATASGNVLTLRMTDGGNGDGDAGSNGRILSTGSPATSTTPSSDPNANSGGGGSSTVALWGLLLLTVLIVGRRRRRLFTQ